VVFSRGQWLDDSGYAKVTPTVRAAISCFAPVFYWHTAISRQNNRGAIESGAGMKAMTLASLGKFAQDDRHFKNSPHQGVVACLLVAYLATICVFQ
jgi:hypothetical protein